MMHSLAMESWKQESIQFTASSTIGNLTDLEKSDILTIPDGRVYGKMVLKDTVSLPILMVHEV